MVMELLSRQVVGWSMGPTLDSNLMMQAPLSAVWRYKAPPDLMSHQDKGCQFSRGNWQRFLKDYKIHAV